MISALERTRIDGRDCISVIQPAHQGRNAAIAAVTVIVAIVCSADVSVAAVVTSQYDLNLGIGYTLIANQLNYPNNFVSEIFPAMPDGTLLEKYNQSSGWVINYFASATGWIDPNMVLGPGEGARIWLPQPATLTIAGEVMQGIIVVPLVPGVQFISHVIPQQIGLAATGFPAAGGDTIQFWSNAAQSYDVTWTYTAGSGWFDGSSYGDPTPAVGESFLYTRNIDNGSAAWVREYTVPEQTVPELTSFGVWLLLVIGGLCWSRVSKSRATPY